jgi:RNA polymerase sigma factor (sigma-70 family)
MGTVAKTDTELVEASRRGEHVAFGQLVERYQAAVCAVSYSSTGDWSLSEDVAQDTFLVAWRHLGQLRETVRLRPWLCGIARNLARKARRRTQREQLTDDEPALCAGGATPFEATAQAEADQVVREALSRVPGAYREVLVLYYRENRSIGDVADALGLTEGAALQRLGLSET